MEILILIAIIAVGASALYVAVNFGTRTGQIVNPRIHDAAEGISEQVKTTGEELNQQVQAITGELRQNSQRVEHMGKATGELNQQVQAITDKLQQNGELTERRYGQIDAWQGQLSGHLQQLDHRLAQLIDSLARQGTQINEIRNYVKRQARQAQGSATKDPLLSAMLEAESHADCVGWGQPPRLYSLTEKTSHIPADHELANEVRDARLDALIPVEQEPLPDGDLIEILADIHWPEDVVGCVLVTELANLPPRSAEDAPVDPAAAGQWASTHPDASPARLVVGVRRTGEHKCGLHIKGEDDVQVRAALASDLVAALLSTFQPRPSPAPGGPDQVV